MKRVSMTIVVLFALTSVFLRPNQIFAQSPTTQPAQNVIYVEGGTFNESLIQTQTDSYGESAPTMSLEFNAQAQANEQFNIPELDKRLNSYKLAIPALTAYTILENSYTPENNTYISGQVGIFTQDASGATGSQGSGTQLYKTQRVSFLDNMDKIGRQLGPNWTQYSFTPSGNTYDYSRNPVEITGTLPSSGSDTGETQPKTTVLLEKGFEAILRLFFERIFDAISQLWNKSDETASASLVSRQRGAYLDSSVKLFLGKTSGDYPYLAGSEKEEVDKAGGIFNTFRPEGLDITKGKDHGAEDNFNVDGQAISTNFTDTNNFASGDTFTKCMLSPLGLQNRIVTDYKTGDCDAEQTNSGGSCEGKELPDLSTSDSNCGLCHMDEFADFLRRVNPSYPDQLPEGKLPDVAIDILHKAAETYKVPAPLLLGTMIHEGAFTWEEFDWSTENVTCWSVEGGMIGQTTFGDDTVCKSHAHPATGSRGAFGWIDKWFYPYRDAINVVQQRSTYNQCNFADAAFAIAKSLYESQGGRSNMPSECNGYEIFQGNGGRVDTCSQWNVKRAATAYYVFSGQCHDGFSRTMNVFQQFSCF